MITRTAPLPILYTQAMSTPTRHTLRLVGTTALALVLAWFAILAFLGRLSFTQPSRYAMIELVADSTLWGWVFGLGFLHMMYFLLTSPSRHAVGLSRTCSAAAAIIGTWTFFTLLWGMTTTVPVSLAVFGPAVFSVVGAQVLATAWNSRELSTT